MNFIVNMAVSTQRNMFFFCRKAIKWMVIQIVHNQSSCIYSNLDNSDIRQSSVPNNGLQTIHPVSMQYINAMS